MKKLMAVMLSVLMLFSLAACTGGGGSSEDDGGKNIGKKGGIPIKEITTENWAQVVEDNFGLTITLPEGWEISSAKSLGGAHIDFTCNTTEEEAFVFLEGIFADLKAMSVSGVSGHYDIDEKPQESIKAAIEELGNADAFNLWLDEEKSKGIHFQYSIHEVLNKETGEFDSVDEVGIYLSQKGSWD